MKNNKIINKIISPFLFLKKHKIFTIILIFLIVYIALMVSSSIFGAEQVGLSIEKGINGFFDNKLVKLIIGIPVGLFILFEMGAGAAGSAAPMNEHDRKEFEKWKTIRKLYK